MTNGNKPGPEQQPTPRPQQTIIISRTPEARSRARRETVESVVVAVILAFLFRAFVAEAFVIPTGSMAPTLQGRHKDVTCIKCGCPYRAGASKENTDRGPAPGTVVATTCPVCRYTMSLDLVSDPNQLSFTGDRILVSKFAYQLGEPERWDVLVFKYPGNAKQNYIKRLVGLPNEEIRIECGDIYVRKEGDDTWRIARKPDRKLRAMLQRIDDTAYIADDLVAIGWPSRWQSWSPTQGTESVRRTLKDDKEGIAIDASDGQERWLRYNHSPPTYAQWRAIDQGEHPPEGPITKLVTDFYAYNAYGFLSNSRDFMGHASTTIPTTKSLGSHWVGDLAVAAEVDVKTSSGELILDLVEGGLHHQCRIDLSSGKATLSLNGGGQAFEADGEGASSLPTATTTVKGPGKYDLQFANVDNQLSLWVGGKRSEFDGPTTFKRPMNFGPVWSPEDPGDLAPAGVGAKDAVIGFDRIRVLRDVYYIALSQKIRALGNHPSDYMWDQFSAPRPGFGHEDDFVHGVFSSPEQWETTPLFDIRRHVEFTLGDEQYFPLGDNSPESQDARLWDTDPHVDRKLLTGEALLIYWPHAWRRPIPFWPNWRRMGLIH